MLFFSVEGNPNVSAKRRMGDVSRDDPWKKPSTVSVRFDDWAWFTMQGYGNAGWLFGYGVKQNDNPKVVREWVLRALKAKASVSFRLLPSMEGRTADIDGLGPAIRLLMEYCPLY